MSTSTIILIVLGLIVLVVLAIGFTLGWKTLTPWIKSGSNVNEISQQCALACSVNSKYDYCSKTFILKDDKKNEVQGVSCNVLSGIPTFKTKWGVEICPSITCEKFACEKLDEDLLKDLVINNEKPRDLLSRKDTFLFQENEYDIGFFANDLSSGEFCKVSFIKPKGEFIKLN